jgi:hypothetical protein
MKGLRGEVWSITALRAHKKRDGSALRRGAAGDGFRYATAVEFQLQRLLQRISPGCDEVDCAFRIARAYGWNGLRSALLVLLFSLLDEEP